MNTFMIKKIFKVYLILSCLGHICITIQQSQEEDSGCAVNLFRWATGRSLLFLRLFLLLLNHVEKLMWNIKKSLLFWCHLTLAQSRDEWSLQNRKKKIYIKLLKWLWKSISNSLQFVSRHSLSSIGKSFSFTHLFILPKLSLSFKSKWFRWRTWLVRINLQVFSCTESYFLRWWT